MANKILIPIPGRLINIADEGHVTGADMVYDDTLEATQADINNQLLGYAAVLGLANFSNASTLTKTTNPEWKYVLTDSEDKVLLGVYQDGTSKAFATVTEIMDCIYSSWTTT